MIKICFAGDITPGGALVYEGGISQEVKDFLNQFDLRVANLESPFSDGSTKCHIKMADPNLGNIIFSPDQSVRILKELKIDVVSLANNHICDCDLEGLKHTIEVLEKNGIQYFGAGRNETETKRPAIITLKNGKKVCLLGYMHADWEAQYPAKGEIGGFNQLILENAINDIRKYKQSCDYVFVCPHWGKEHTLFPLICDAQMMQRFIDEGVTGVMGSHTHLSQSAFVLKNVAIAMSMGNYVFPDRYIIHPRQTYYPTDEERKATGIPTTLKFPIVNELTYKQSPKDGRVGLICAISISEGNLVCMSKRYTILDSNHILRFYHPDSIFNLKRFLISVLLRDKNLYCYRFFCKIATKLSYILGNKKKYGNF